LNKLTRLFFISLMITSTQGGYEEEVVRLIAARRIYLTSPQLGRYL
jgi:hypothetical protein